MRIKWILITFVFSLMSCSTTSKHIGWSKDRSLLFPDAVYYQDIYLNIKKSESESDDFNFSGIVRKKSDEIFVVGLGPLSTTLFTAKKQKGESLQLTIFFNPLKRHRAKIEKVFANIQYLMLLNMKKYSTLNLKSGLKLHFKEWDENHVPRWVQFSDRGFKVVVRTTKYEVSQ